MNSNRYLNEIGQTYGHMLDRLVVEARKKPAKSVTAKPVTATFPKAEDGAPDKPAFVGKNTGPENADGFRKELDDPKKSKKMAGKFSQKSESTSINTHMNKTFDQLFEDTIKGRTRLNENETDIEAAAALPEGEGDAIPADGDEGELPGDGGDESQTPADRLRAAIELLQSALDELEGDADGVTDPGDPGDPSDADAALDMDGDDELPAGEATEMEEVKDSEGQKLTKPGNKVPGVVTTLAKGGKADYKVAGKVGSNEELGHALSGKAHPLQGKNNKVAGTAGKVGHQIGA